MKPSVRTACAGYLIIVGAVYFLLLRNIGDEQDLELVADQLLHYATPVLFTIDWLVFVPKGQLRWTMIGTCLVAPIFYGCWMMVHGALTNWYPYPIFNVTKVGPAKAVVNLAAFLGVFIATALVLVVVDRTIASFRRANRSQRR